MVVKVIRDKCIGCGLCISICPEVFEMEDDAISHVKDANGDKKYPKQVKESVDSCPTQAIEMK